MKVPAFVQATWFQWAARLAVGGVFVYASLQKISDPGAFAENVQHFRMMPFALTNLVAVILPWLELFLGVFLVAGIWLRGSALTAAVLLGMFILALAQAAARGISLHCGCFSSAGAASGRGELLLHMAGNAALALLALGLFPRSRKKNPDDAA